MIVPQNRLLFWTAMLLPFAATGVMLPSAAAASLALIAGLVGVAFIDALMARGRLEGVRIEMPEVVRLSKDREGSIPLLIRNDPLQVRSLRISLPFPREIHFPKEEFQVSLPEKNPHSRIDWPCTPAKRGSFWIKKCFMETGSPLGFWNVRKSVDTDSEIRAYPNLLQEKKHLAALFLNRGNFGVHAQRIVGQGRDFEKLREYIPGDGYDQIHWKATAKRQHPVTKVFQIERTQEIYVVLDASRLSGRELNGESMLERYITAALVLGLAAEQQGDLFGILSFHERVRSFVRARNGKAHCDACRDSLYALQPRTVTPDFEDICSFIRLRLRRRALLIFLTDLDDPVLAESLVRNLEVICRQHLIVIATIRSRNAVPLFQGPPLDSVDQMYQRLGGHLLWYRLREMEKILQRHGVRLLQLDDGKSSSQLVSHYLSVKQRQLL